MTTPLGDFGPPTDAVGWAALALALAALVLARFRDRIVPRLTEPYGAKRAVLGLALVAALLSAGYVAHYLRGGPRIVDATSYLLQARALAEGHVAFPVPSPGGSFRGRFLLASADGTRLVGIFPPGYPMILALGVLSHVPMMVGPALAALLVVVTALLGRRASPDPRVPVLAAALSAVSAVLRYHTADTMSHGLAALLFAGVVLRIEADGAASAIVAGALASLLVATRPVTGLVAFAVAFAVRPSRARAALLVVGALPGLAALAVYERVATGHWFLSAQSAYYALADSPAGCFRFGFGEGIGCRFEHGDFVAARLPHGYGLVEALGTTLRRLKMHLADAANAEPFFLVLSVAVVRALRDSRQRLFALPVLGIVFAYLPFYFDGNYPGGGARFFADALPFEHVLLALGLVRLRLARFSLPLALAGFSFHTSHDHERLRDREGGRPMFESSVLDRAGVRRGLVFVDTDHGFSLGFDPDAMDPKRGIVVARRRHDAHDGLLWDRLGRPPAYDYEYAPSDIVARPRIVPVAMALPDVLRFEAEAEWPPLAVSGGSVLPFFHPAASRGRALRLIPATVGGRVTARFALPPSRSGIRRLRAGFLGGPDGGAAELRIGHVVWSIALHAAVDGDLVAGESPQLEHTEMTEVIDVSSVEPIRIDFLELQGEP